MQLRKLYNYISLILIINVAGYNILYARNINIEEIKQMQNKYVEQILMGLNVGIITKDNYNTILLESKKPVVIIFYINNDLASRKLATMARYIIIKYNNVINFYAYKVGEQYPSNELLSRYKEKYRLNYIPAILYYNINNFELDILNPKKLYNIPRIFFWKYYYNKIVTYIESSIKSKQE